MATSTERDARLNLRDKLLEVFNDSAVERWKREDLTDAGYGPEPGWLVYERQQMLAAVNTMRAERGLPPVDMDVIVAIDTQCAGHFDYARKYALYCSELAGRGPGAEVKA